MKIPFMKPLAAMLVAAAVLPVIGTPMATIQATTLGKNTSNGFSMKMPVTQNEWKRGLRHNPFAQRDKRHRTISQSDAQIGPVNSFGTLDAPDGTQWVYTANFDIDEEKGYTAAHLKVYDSDNQLLGSIDDTFELAEHQTTINQVLIDPNVTKKFFNVDDKYEIIIYIHATTDDYTGCNYQHVFTLAPNQTTPLLTIPGTEVLAVDLAADQWSEDKQMVMMREAFDEDGNYFIHYDIYGRASWSSLHAPELLHTFTLNYENISGSGGNAFPITLQKIGGKAHYAIAYYEKPFFDPEIPFYEEPVVTEDNTFIIDLYSTDCFNAEGETKPYKSVRIPMATEPGYLYTFPGLGAFMGNDDFSVGVFDNTDNPYFIITYDNYVTASDDFISDIHVYDMDGNRVKTIAEGVTDYMQLSDVPGESKQFCMTNDAEEELMFINFPSAEKVAGIPYVYDDRLLSTAIDRVPAQNGYRYVISCSNGDCDAEGNILHPIGYFNENGTLNHWDMVNLGPDVVMAQTAIIAPWLNPYLFDTDTDIDYMFLVKLPAAANPESAKMEERLWIINTYGEKIADFGPSEELGELSTIEVLNAKTANPVLSTAYYKWKEDCFTLGFNKLPFTCFSAGGKGTKADPYIVSTLGDLMQISKAPAAHYVLAGDIDCENYPFAGNTADFTGSLDGQNHTISNLTLVGNGIISDILGGAEVKNIHFQSPKVYPNGSYAGLIASNARYNGTNAPLISNIHVNQAVVESHDFQGAFGTIIGQLTTGSTLTTCSVNDADINLPRATVGGLVGDVSASGANVNAVAFSGSLNARVAGGIVGSASAIDLRDAHVNADINASLVAGGIVGEMDQYMDKRGTFSTCFVEGTMTSTNANDPSVGGVAGSVVEGDNLCVTHNVVALSAINYPADAQKSSAHRIVGHTCVNELGQILWDDPWWEEHPDDAYDHQDEWPRETPKPDKGFNNNHAIASLARIDASINDALNTVEGKSVDEITADFLTSQGFAFGNDATTPWAINDGRFGLWFEDGSHSDIHVAQAGPAQPLRLINGVLTANGKIEIFTLSGAKVAMARSKFQTSRLPAGIYVARTAEGAVKFTVK